MRLAESGGLVAPPSERDANEKRVSLPTYSHQTNKMRTAALFSVGQEVNGVNAAACMEQAEMNFTVSARPLSFMGNDGQSIPIFDKVAIVRDDTDAIMSVMSDSYGIVQPQQCFDLADALVSEGGNHYCHAGMTKGGRRIFLQAKIGSEWIAGGNPDENHQTYLTAMNSFDGSSGLEFYLGANRMFCLNQVNLIKKKAAASFKVYHRKGVMGRMQEAARILGLAQEAQEAYKKSIERMMEEEVSQSYVEGFLKAIVPAEEKIVDGVKEIATRAENRRREIEGLFRNGTGTYGKSKYDLWNGVTEYVDHFQGGRVTQKRLNSADASADIEGEQRFERAIFGAGARLKEHAYELLTA
jgi:phage/plasmid-like protein (TIGR03299 family)